MESAIPIDIVEKADEVIGYQPLNGMTGRLQQVLTREHQGRPVAIDSSKVAHTMKGWTTTGDKDRLDALLQYALCETNNYNNAIMFDQLRRQVGSLKNLEEAYASKTVLPECRTDLALLLNSSLTIDLPGFIGQTVDVRAVAARLKIAHKAATVSRWRQIARGILDETIPKEVQQIYTGASKAANYYPLPTYFVDAVVECCAISSNISGTGLVSYLPQMAVHVRSAIENRLNEVHKGNTSKFEDRIRDAVIIGWTPPGLTREEACLQYQVDLSVHSDVGDNGVDSVPTESSTMVDRSYDEGSESQPNTDVVGTPSANTVQVVNKMQFTPVSNAIKRQTPSGPRSLRTNGTKVRRLVMGGGPSNGTQSMMSSEAPITPVRRFGGNEESAPAIHDIRPLPIPMPDANASSSSSSSSSERRGNSMEAFRDFMPPLTSDFHEMQPAAFYSPCTTGRTIYDPRMGGSKTPKNL